MDHISLTLDTWPIELVKEYELNAKLHPESQVAAIAASIEAFDFNDPIGVDEDGVILEGHGRLAAAKKLGLREVPVLIVSGFRNDKEKSLYRIAHNRLTLSTGFDVKKLALELDLLSQYEHIPVSALGFDERDLQAIMRQASSGGATELPPSAFKYTLIFSDKDQQASWKKFLAKLRVTNPDKSLSATRLFIEYIKNSGVVNV